MQTKLLDLSDKNRSTFGKGMIGEVAFYKINRTHLVIAWIQVDPTCNLWISALQQMSCHFEINFSRLPLPTTLIELWAAFSIHIKNIVPHDVGLLVQGCHENLSQLFHIGF